MLEPVDLVLIEGVVDREGVSGAILALALQAAQHSSTQCVMV